jgi:hypothetical protein
MTHFAEADYWKECDFIKWSKSIFSNSTTSISDVKALCELGLPEWAAPNINFDMYDIHNGILKIGEARDDRDILLNLNSLNISISDNQLLVNTSPHKLRESLKLYAIMVEKAIASDEEAFVENRVSEQLVDELKDGLKKLDPECLSGKSFWIDEIKRLKKQAC